MSNVTTTSSMIMIAEARKRRINKIFELDGHVYAFDSITIDLCRQYLSELNFVNIKSE